MRACLCLLLLLTITPHGGGLVEYTLQHKPTNAHGRSRETAPRHQLWGLTYVHRIYPTCSLVNLLLPYPFMGSADGFIKPGLVQLNVMERDHPHVASGVYALRLEEGKYYVGESSDIDNRIEDHASEWTMVYRPVSVDDVFPAKHGLKELEREVTLMYMQEHGWENVRGAGWTRVEMENPPKPLRDAAVA